MKFNTKSLQDNIKKLAGISRKNVAEVQKGILYKDNSLIAYNSELSMALPTDPTLMPETFIIPDKAFAFIGALTGDETEVSETDGKIVISCGKARSEIPALDMKGFVEPKFTMQENPAVIKAETLYQLLDCVLYAIGENPSDKKMSGAYFASGDGKLTVTALNGYQIASATLPYEGELKMNVPKKALTELQRLKLKGDVTVSSDGKGATFRSDGCALYTRLIEGEFFDIQKILVQETKTTTFKKMEILEALERVNACAGVGGKEPVVLEFSGESLKISYEGTPKYEETLDGFSIGKDLKIAFSPKLMAESLGSVPGEDVGFGFTAAQAPLTLVGENCTAFLMPVVVRG